MPSTRNLLAFVGGGLAYAGTLYRFLSYTERNRLPFNTYVIFAALALVIGLVASVGTSTRRYRAAKFVVFGTWAAHALVVAADMRRDPTDHNLLPFEFIILGVFAAAAYLGAAMVHAFDVVTRRSS